MLMVFFPVVGARVRAAGTVHCLPVYGHNPKSLPHKYNTGPQNIEKMTIPNIIVDPDGESSGRGT